MNSLRIGLFGGHFNPFHNGHLYCLKTAKKKFNLSWIEVIPVYKNPFKKSLSKTKENLSFKKRLKMLEVALKPHLEDFRLNPLEFKRKGVSYTIDTLLSLKKKYKNHRNKSVEFYLIIGFDQWKKFHLWKDFNKILKEAHLVVIYRKGDVFSKSFKSYSHFAQLFKKRVQLQKGLSLTQVRSFKQDRKIDGLNLELKTGQRIYFLSIGTKKGIFVSSTLVRDKIRKGEDVSKLIPFSLKNYILKQKFYRD